MRGAIGGGLVVGAGTAVAVGSSPALPGALVYVAVSVLGVWSAWRLRHIPYRWMLVAIVVVLGCHVVGGVAVGEWRPIRDAVIGAVLAFVAFAAVRRITNGGFALHDVADAPLLGVTLGWFGLGRVALGLGLGLVLGAVLAGPAMLIDRRHPMGVAVFSNRRVLTNGPALAIGAWLALWFGDSITRIYGG